MRNPLLPLLVLCSLLLPGCGLIDRYFLPESDDTVQEIFESGNDHMREKDYVAAARNFSRVKDDYPFSPYAVEAELSLGDAYFLDREYALAAEAYRDFETLHPRHEAIPYVLYQLGMSLRMGYGSVDRAATDVEEALEYFHRLEQTYPDTEYARKAGEQIAACRKLLAQREIFIGNVFWSMGNYEAAWTRFQHVVDTYPDVTEEAEYARGKGEVAYMRYREGASEDIREQREGSWKNMFRWL